MPSSFFGLNIAATGLQAQQNAMNVVGHNIANANNPNYKRQQVRMEAAQPLWGSDLGTGAFGSGTRVTEIRRITDTFIESQVLTSQQNVGRWSAEQQGLDKVVSIIGEPTDYGLSNDLDKFWNSWQELSMNPENVATRNNVLEYGATVSRSLNQLYTQIEQVRNWQDDSIQSGVDDINRLASQLANVNDQIQRTLGAGQNPNDLQDQRDAILSELANIADIQVFGSGGAGDVVTLGGHVLIQGNSALQLKTEKDPVGHLQIKWASDSSDAQISSGSLGGVLDLQQNILPDYLKSLDDIAGALITRVNEIHSTGYGTDGSTGLDFFTGTGARDIGVNSVLVADPKKVASATAAGSPGDGSIALAIANIKSEALLSGATLGDSYRTLVSKIGGDSSNASNMTDAQTSLQQQLLTQQQSISGVSIDEELTDMVRFQQAYNASARIMTVMDEMLGTIIQSMGVGGR